MTSKRRYFYSCYGFLIASEFVLPELDPAPQGEADIIVSYRPDVLLNEQPPEGGQPAFLPDLQVFDFANVARLEIHKATEIRVGLRPGISEDCLGLPLLGPVLATLMHYRGRLVIHGSAIVVGHELWGFVGDRGAGKSTMAAFLIRQGFPVFNDDLISIGFPSDSAPVAHPGYAATKIMKQAFDRVGGLEGDILETGGLPYKKMRIRLAQKPISEAMPLSRLCLLERGETASLQEMPEREALNAVFQHIYMRKYGAAPAADGRAQAWFSQSAALVKTTPVSILTVPSTLDRMPEAVELVSKSAGL